MAQGDVVSMAPKPGVTVPKGSQVSMVVSKGPPPVVVPDLYTMSEADAKAALKGLGFKVKVTYPIGITPFDRVVKQSVKATRDRTVGLHHRDPGRLARRGRQPRCGCASGGPSPGCS